MKKNQTKNLIIRLKIAPNASKNEIIFEDDGIKVKVKAPPIENKANKELIVFLSKSLNHPKSKINLKKGETSKLKTIEIEDMTEEQFNEKIKSSLIK